MVSHVVLFIALFGLLTSSIYLALTVAGTLRFRRRSARAANFPSPTFPGVTLLKPLHGLEPNLRENLESFFRQDYPEFEIIFGARNSADPSLALVRELAAKYPRVQVRVVSSGEPTWPNAKVFNLNTMLRAASHPYLIVSDSDVEVGPGYIASIVTPLLDPAVGMVTCVYRGVPTGGLWSRLEALGMSVELTSGVLVADMLEGMKFALGPTMATRKDCLEQIGGFAALGDYLADDFVLGNLLAAAGYRVVLSSQVINHYVINHSLATSLQHQVRWAKSTRRSRPKGHFGASLTYAAPFAILGLLGGLLAHRPLLGTALLAYALMNRMALSVIAGWYGVGDTRAFSQCWLYPVRDLLGFCYWAASYFGGSRTMWRGDRYLLQPGGRMVREGIPPAERIPA